MSAPRILDEQARGWLRHMWEKATTPDDWSSTGEPHPWWDRDSTPPMCTFPRFDLFEPSYALAIMSDVTPAWREVYARIADELIARHTTFWAVIDWVTLIGPDPRRDSYPPEWQVLLPAALRGRYETPGWTANGIEPWGLQPDPIGADGNLFFRGFFNLLLGLYRYIAGDDKWDRSFPVTGYRERQFHWSHSRITDFLTLQMEERPQGPHCENTKIWPNCVSGAGLGLQLYDALLGTDNQRVYHRWLEFAKQHYMKTKRGELSWFAMYYDPLQEVAHAIRGPTSALALLESTPYMYPADREFVGQLYEMAMRQLGWSDPRKPIVRLLPDPRPIGRALFLAREFGDQITEARLREIVEDEFEPRMFGDERDRFGYWFGLDTPWPRGQLTGVLMMSQVGEPGAWWRIFNEPNLVKHREPTVEGVDYPNVGIAQAYNDPDAGVLWVRTCAGAPSRRGAPTTLRVTNLPDPAAVSVTCDGEDFTAVQVIGEAAIEITSDIDDHLFRLTVGTAGERSVTDKRGAGLARVSNPHVIATPRAQPSITGGISYPPPSPAPQATSCSCCGLPSGARRREQFAAAAACGAGAP
jgi:Linalool dehydratase/isomerase